MKIDVKEMPELRVATVRHTGPYSRISEAFERLSEAAAAARLVGADSKLIAIYHDDPATTAEQALRSDAAISVPPDVELPEDLDEQRIPAGRYACAVHVGPYEKLGDAWASFTGQWLPRSGHRAGPGAKFETYLNTPDDVPKGELRTEMYIPLA